MGIIASPSRKPAFPIGEGAISTPLGRRAMDENKLQVEDELAGGSMFASNKILITMVVIALIAVLIGMGRQRSAPDKSADVYQAEDQSPTRARSDDRQDGRTGIHH